MLLSKVRGKSKQRAGVELPSLAPNVRARLGKPRKMGATVCDMKQLENDAGQPAVVDGNCRLCDDAVEPQDWGRPTCRGCSIVDRDGFENHLLAPLIQGREDVATQSSHVMALKVEIASLGDVELR